jgi:HlyD family secretion protein
MELPLHGKVKRPLPWLMGLMAAGILAVGGATYTAIKVRTPKVNLDKLTVPVQAKNITVPITANGKVVPIQSVNLSPNTAGRLAQLSVEQGDQVQKGQIVARMEDADVKARVAQAKANLSKAQASLAEAQAGSRPEEIRQAQARLSQAQARLEEARAGNPSEIDQARAQVKAAQSRLGLAQVRADRYRNLSAQGAVALDKRDEALTEERNARAALDEAQQRLQKVQSSTRPEINQLEAAVAEVQAEVQRLQNGQRPEQIAQLKAVVEGAEAELQAVQVQLQDTVITAPFSGIVTQKYATEGAFVTPTTSASSTDSATSTSIIAIAKGLEILADVPETNIRQIKRGQSVEIKADAFGDDKVFKGRVKLVAPEAVLVQNVTSFQVRVELLTGQQELRSKMNVGLTFLGEQVSNALVVPSVAIITKDAKFGVMVPDSDNKPKFQPVTIEPMTQDQPQIWVLNGLRQGQRVFIELPENYKKENQKDK